jgi:cell fate (sporulation/competence/biofilm development) regulator YlbF (YheA/YmcA/DUF963 family)
MAHLEALRNAQTAEAIRLRESYQSIRNLETAIAATQAAGEQRARRWRAFRQSPSARD